MTKWETTKDFFYTRYCACLSLSLTHSIVVINNEYIFFNFNRERIEFYVDFVSTTSSRWVDSTWIALRKFFNYMARSMIEILVGVCRRLTEIIWKIICLFEQRERFDRSSRYFHIKISQITTGSARATNEPSLKTFFFLNCLVRIFNL